MPSYPLFNHKAGSVSSIYSTFWVFDIDINLVIRYSNLSSSRTGRRSRFAPRRFVHSQRTKGIQSHRANSRRRGLLWGEKLSDLRIITGHDFRNVRRNSRLQRSPRHSSEIDEGVKLMFL